MVDKYCIDSINNEKNKSHYKAGQWMCLSHVGFRLGLGSWCDLGGFCTEAVTVHTVL